MERDEESLKVRKSEREIERVCAIERESVRLNDCSSWRIKTETFFVFIFIYYEFLLLFLYSAGLLSFCRVLELKICEARFQMRMHDVPYCRLKSLAHTNACTKSVWQERELLLYIKKDPKENI